MNKKSNKQQWKKWVQSEIGSYVMQIGTCLYDARDSICGLQYVNTAKGTNLNNNLKMLSSGSFQTKYKIRNGTEFLIPYQRCFWSEH